MSYYGDFPPVVTGSRSLGRLGNRLALTAERLADALDRVVRQGDYAKAAARGAEHMAGEDGAARTAEAVERLIGG
ncbi:hypothetical protein SAMN05216483_4584 [Streptomyces sp. 2131.1]|uniref:hypothetical protein n=1 Tax=Streptomyces sp. 2131.1 TaxID=1855346 RepID=UPI00089656BE|nr:hypothetical protein SAMN05216483_4584 [Streptomyces sp. 2131.1]